MSLLTSLISSDAGGGAAAVAGDPYELDTIGGATGNNLGLGTLTQNTIYLYKLRVQQARSITVVDVANGATINGNFAVAIGTISGGTWTRLATTGVVAQSGASALQSPAIALDLVPDTDYYAAFGTDSATATFGRLVSALAVMAGAGGMQYSKATAYSSGIPSSLATLTASAAHTVWMRFR